jgi:glycosyltransferase involved in cell wall biosynthesis
LGINENKIEVVYHGHSQTTFNNKLFENYKIPKKYILFVGERKRHKNFLRFVDAVSYLKQKNIDINVVCVGGGAFSNNEMNYFIKNKIEDLFIQFSVPPEVLPCFYQNADLFIYPSLYEGFGIPILEAFSNNCPVILSNTSCFSEIAGDAALYFSPESHIEMAETILNVIENMSVKDKLIKSGTAKLSNFSWQKTASETENIYSKILF